jgi:hypothetical protein
VEEDLGIKPQLIQIATAWSSREGALLGRN